MRNQTDHPLPDIRHFHLPEFKAECADDVVFLDICLALIEETRLAEVIEELLATGANLWTCELFSVGKEPTHVHSRLVFLLALNIFLLIVGCLMDIYAATVVVVPLILPISQVFGIHPLHLGMIFLVNLELGYLTPPVGLNIFVIKSQLPDIPIQTMYAGILPFLAVDLIAIVLLVAFPGLALWLPGVLL